MADEMGGGPVSAGSIASQAGKKLGTPDAPYTGVPGYTDTVFDPFSINPSPAMAEDGGNQGSPGDVGLTRRERERNMQGQEDPYYGDYNDY